jgi:hypothetical protein
MYKTGTPELSPAAQCTTGRHAAHIKASHPALLGNIAMGILAAGTENGVRVVTSVSGFAIAPPRTSHQNPSDNKDAKRYCDPGDCAARAHNRFHIHGCNSPAPPPPRRPRQLQFGLLSMSKVHLYMKQLLCQLKRKRRVAATLARSLLRCWPGTVIEGRSAWPNTPTWS